MFIEQHNKMISEGFKCAFVDSRCLYKEPILAETE